MNLATRTRKARLGEQLLAKQVITETQLQQALENQRNTGAFLGEALVALGLVSVSTVGHYLETATGFPFVDLAELTINMSVAQAIPEDFARRERVLPFERRGDAILVAMADPLDLSVGDELRARLESRIIPHLALGPDLRAATNRIFDGRHKAQSVLDEIGDAKGTDADLTTDELVGLAEDAPIVRLVNGIIHSAIASGASDIHIEPQEDVLRVRFRLDGLLLDHMTMPRRHQAAVGSRIKIMSQLNIAERRRPQDGRFTFQGEGKREYDLRVSLMPVIYGEKIVMRILEKANSFADPSRLGFFPEQRGLFDRFIKRPHGIILVTGPTGSGKSTTLYAALNMINDPKLNINTIEDPVEYNLKGVNQVQVNPKIGVTFSVGLRTLVRQDPDVIMVGEIRDAETAEIAIQAALTGHLVLSTLHTNDAPGALVRLQNMGVEPFLISSAVIGILGQRLVRTVCQHCREVVLPTQATIEALGLPVQDGRSPGLAHGKGCAKCGGQGMKGRTAVYEIMPMTDPLRAMVLRRSSAAEMREQAIQEGMVTMRDSAVRKVLEGSTTPEEVMRVLFAEE